MRKTIVQAALIVIFIILVACSNQSGPAKDDKAKSEKTEAVNKTENNPVGIYSTTENGKQMQFVLKADGTGYENYQGTETRPFKWKQKNEKIFFVYDGETMEWELPVNISTGEIRYGTLVYKKE